MSVNVWLGLSCCGYADRECDNKLRTVDGQSVATILDNIQADGWRQVLDFHWRCGSCVEENEFYQETLAELLHEAGNRVAETVEESVDGVMLRVKHELQLRFDVWANEDDQ